jgi:hypothetical protein
MNGYLAWIESIELVDVPARWRGQAVVSLWQLGHQPLPRDYSVTMTCLVFTGETSGGVPGSVIEFNNN